MTYSSCYNTFSVTYKSRSSGHVAISEALLSGRADVDARSGQHDTALMWAAHLGTLVWPGFLKYAPED